jgi:hypothetical protein
MTCYFHFIYVGSSYLDACSGLYTAGVYQQVAFLDLTQNVYISNGQCQASTCDWGGYYGYTSNTAVAYQANFTCGYGSFAYACGYSDERLKNGIETLKDSLQNIMKIEAVEYDWNENLREYDYFKTQQKLHTIGLIAQNVRLYYPEVVRINSDGYYSIDYSKLNAVLVEGIKEQSILIDNIDNELEYLETKLN